MQSYIGDYPRPQLVRPEWKNLNGEWDFKFDDWNQGEKAGCSASFKPERKIHVPFTYETELSGIHEVTFHPCVWYERTVTLKASDLAGHLLLHFEGSDFRTKVWVNGNFVGEHRGAYERFTFDITDAACEGDNLIVVRVWDSDSLSQPRGKQRWEPVNFGCWYVQTTGIWKTVWMETVPEIYIDALKMTPDLEHGRIHLEAHLAGEDTEPSQTVGRNPAVPGNLQICAEVSFDGAPVSSAQVSVRDGRAVLEADTMLEGDPRFAFGPLLWTPEHPALYDLKITLLRNGQKVDTVLSYFGMREIRIDRGNILLNSQPLYQKLILDQGYWPQSGLTPPSEEALIQDIDSIHAAGFNGLRKHMKIEDERFLYWCDVKGMLVWSEMAAFYEFTDEAVRQFTSEWMQILAQNYNHPCIITWTPFNESWGIPSVKTSRRQQMFTEAVYHLTKTFDPMRPVICDDGWEHTVSDIVTLHDYEEYGERFTQRYADKDKIVSNEVYYNRDRSAIADGCIYRGQPVIISEYGGIAFADRSDGQWGYGNGVQDEKTYLERFRKITEAIQDVPYIVGYCYTQVSDVEQEVNGIMTADRQFKVPESELAAVNQRDTAMHH